MRRYLLPLAPAVVALLAQSNVACSSGSAEEYNACIQEQTANVIAAGTVKIASTGNVTAALIATDPARAAEAVRASARASMQTTLLQQRASAIASIRCESVRPTSRGFSDEASSFAPSSSNSADSSGSAGGGASQVSGTNNQVAGVDEADFVKNDNKYIYVANGAQFRIVQAWPADAAQTIATVTVPGEAKKLFVEGDRALVFSSVAKTGNANGNGYGGYGYGGYSATGECTYGYDGCVPSGDGTETTLSIFDIADRANPTLVRTVHSTSSFIAARRIGTAVHTVLANQPAQISYNTYPSSMPSDPTERDVARAYDELAAKNDALIAAFEMGDVLPKFDDSANATTTQSLFQSSAPDGNALTSVLSVDLGADASTSVSTVIGRPGFVYSSAGALYISVRHEQSGGWGWFDGRSETELSTVHKFALGAVPSQTHYVGSGYVKGRVLNQFAMDEMDGKLRIATTTGHLPSPDAHNTLSVMEDKGGSLDVIGQVDNIAKSEDIRSVRFDGDKGYIVTFKKTDPLYVFDLKNPADPKILGELKIPGFSTYMHLMDATHLLTIGYDAADQGDFAYFSSVLLQIFDVANPADPKLVHKETIGTRGTSSEALTNHLAFTYFAPKNILALPMTVCEGGDANQGMYGTQMTFSGLMVYDTTVANGFSLKGKVAHPNTTNSQSGMYDSASCYNWWTNATSEVKRSIIMDDYVFSVSSRRIKVNRLDALATDVRDISIE